MPNIHIDNPSVEDNAIYIQEAELWMPFTTMGVIIIFHTQTTRHEEIYRCNKVFITPDIIAQDPHATNFTSNKDPIVYW